MATQDFGYLSHRALGMDRCRQAVERLLSEAGIRTDGRRPWDIEVRDPRFFPSVLGRGSLGLGESYMDNWWQCEELEECIARMLRHKLDCRVPGFGSILALLRAKLFNLQSPQRSDQVGRHHYDIGNDLYRSMLDTNMIYSCAYWRSADDLEQAQIEKLDLIFRKLGLRPGMQVLDIGCGWGGAARRAALEYGVQVTGITISREQADYARRWCADTSVEIRQIDYREISGRYDRIYSIGMFEHVGVKNYRDFFTRVRDLLTPNGLFVLHTIGGNVTKHHCDRWMAKYIFPNSMIPSPLQISRAIEGLLILEDWHNFGVDYERTLLEWRRRFEAAWPELRDRYSNRFYRMWRYYLSACAGAFRARDLQLWQLVLSPGGVQGGYRAPR